MGSSRYPQAKQLLITADSGGRHRARARLWKRALQRCSADTGLRVCVSHLPPGPSTWQKIEHRLCCHLTAHWHGKPLESREVVVSLSGGTSTSTGLRIRAALDRGQYPTGVKGSKAAMEEIRLKRSDFHGDWHSTIFSHQQRKAARQANA